MATIKAVKERGTTWGQNAVNVETRHERVPCEPDAMILYGWRMHCANRAPMKGGL